MMSLVRPMGTTCPFIITGATISLQSPGVSPSAGRSDSMCTEYLLSP